MWAFGDSGEALPLVDRFEGPRNGRWRDPLSPDTQMQVLGRKTTTTKRLDAFLSTSGCLRIEEHNGYNQSGFAETHNIMSKIYGSKLFQPSPVS